MFKLCGIKELGSQEFNIKANIQEKGN